MADISDHVGAEYRQGKLWQAGRLPESSNATKHIHGLIGVALLCEMQRQGSTQHIVLRTTQYSN